MHAHYVCNSNLGYPTAPFLFAKCREDFSTSFGLFFRPRGACYCKIEGRSVVKGLSEISSNTRNSHTNLTWPCFFLVQLATAKLALRTTPDNLQLGFLQAGCASSRRQQGDVFSVLSPRRLGRLASWTGPQAPVDIMIIMLDIHNTDTRNKIIPK